MGRGKIDIKKIESASKRQVTFTKRRGGLMKKAGELAVLCDAQVAIIIYSCTGKLYEFASSNMREILSRFEECWRIKNNIPPEYNPENEIDALKEEMEKLKQKQQRLLGRELSGMSCEELHELEQQLVEGLLSIKDAKEALMVQQLQQSRDNEERIAQENETLREKVEALQSFFASTSYSAPVYAECRPLEQTDSALGQSSSTTLMECNNSTDDANLDISLQLGPPTVVCGKMKKSP